MNAVIVRYEQKILPFRRGMWQCRVITPQAVAAMIRRIDSGEIDEVVLGPNACTGWRIGVNREVRFVERATTDDHDAAAQVQASMRIVQLEKTS